jgi:hypothetical protein
MATSSQSPKFSDGWIPYLALTFVGTFMLSEFFMVNIQQGLKTDIRNGVGLVFLVLLTYFFSKTDKKLVQEYVLPLIFAAVLFTSGYILIFKIFLF